MSDYQEIQEEICNQVSMIDKNTMHHTELTRQIDDTLITEFDVNSRDERKEIIDSLMVEFGVWDRMVIGMGSRTTYYVLVAFMPIMIVLCLVSAVYFLFTIDELFSRVFLPISLASISLLVGFVTKRPILHMAIRHQCMKKIRSDVDRYVEE